MCWMMHWENIEDKSSVLKSNKQLWEQDSIVWLTLGSNLKSRRILDALISR